MRPCWSPILEGVLTRIGALPPPHPFNSWGSNTGPTLLGSVGSIGVPGYGCSTWERNVLTQK